MLYILCIAVGVLVGWYLRPHFTCVHPEFEEVQQINVYSASNSKADGGLPIGEKRILKCKTCGHFKQIKLMT